MDTEDISFLKRKNSDLKRAAVMALNRISQTEKSPSKNKRHALLKNEEIAVLWKRIESICAVLVQRHEEAKR